VPLHKALEMRALSHRRSLNSEVIDCFERALPGKPLGVPSVDALAPCAYVAPFHLSRSLYSMQKIGFSEALDTITQADPRYQREAYAFLRDALDYTIKQKKKSKEDPSRHVSGPELLGGIRLFALKEFGPMAITVLDYWGVHECVDFGHMVFNLINAGIFGKTERDTLADFSQGYDFREAFVLPFLPPSVQLQDTPPSRIADHQAPSPTQLP